MQSRREAHNRLYNIDLYKKVKQLLSNFDGERCGNKTPVSYDVITIKEKFHDTDSLLCEEVERYVAMYFVMLNTVVSDFERENGDFRVDSLRVQIKDAYHKVRDGGFSQEEIYYKLTMWLADRTDADESICRVVVAYFVQLCDVFEPVHLLT
jgi:hypothetical protein